MRLALTGGGTGGHIIPALAVMEAVQARVGGTAEVCFFGPQDRGERARVEAAGVRFVAVPSAAVRGRGPLQLARAAWRVLSGTFGAVGRSGASSPMPFSAPAATAASPAVSLRNSCASRSSFTCPMFTRAGRSKPNACSPRT